MASLDSLLNGESKPTVEDIVKAIMYTKIQLDGGQLDDRYYTEIEIDIALALKASLTGATFTGQVKGIAPVAGADLTRKDYVDTKDLLRVPKTGVQDTDDWNGVAYTDPDAVGANPTAKIYPDGTIVGSTDNGNYIKYPNGEFEFYVDIATVTTSIFLGAVYASPEATVTYPLVATQITINVTANDNNDLYVWAGGVRDKTLSNAKIFICGNAGTNNGIIGYTAKGRWK